MTDVQLEVFAQTSDYCELRLHSGGPVRTRGLDRGAVDALITVVDTVYGGDSEAQRWANSSRFHELGARLYAFLDGEERWFEPVLQTPGVVTLRITAEERLRHMPWELLVHAGSYAAVTGPALLLPLRAARATATAGAGTANRPLRVLFMATSPEGVEPELSYEEEEAAILRATLDSGTELIVEESGTLEGLRFTAESYGAGYFDVLHISGHADVVNGQPVFVVENELGGPSFATPDQIAQAMAGQWPRIVFVSGCLTGSAPNGGTFPSMSESLVHAGAPLVLGWALPVGDASATTYAASLYQSLAAGRPIDEAVVRARQDLYAAQSPSWHLLRVYGDATPLKALVTALNTPGRHRVSLRHAADVFLDPQTRISRVASRAAFVGRRRVIQRCLRTLKAPLGSPASGQALVLHGMGGLGKSTLASRLLERMPTHQRAVWFGRVDSTKLRELTSKISFPSMEDQLEADRLLNDERADLLTRLRFLLTGPLATTPCLFVFDDFEQGNLDDRDGAHVLSPDMAEILPALLTAIDQTNSRSRVIVTSRYRFPAPAGTTVRVESLETLNDVEQTKKIANLPNLTPEARHVDPTTKERAIEVAAGNPRLLDWLNLIAADDTLDVVSLLAAVETEADRFRREDILAQKLLDSQPEAVGQMLAKVNVVELPIPVETVHAVHEHPDADRHIDRAVQLGLLEEGTDPENGERRYFVSNVLRPLIRPLITDDEYTQACGAAARSLYRLWVTGETAPPEPVVS